MTRIREMIQARAGQRKRGADLTQAMLYAAFAIIVLISVLAMYQVVSLNTNKTTATRTMSMASSEARTLYRNSDDFTGLSSEQLIAAGAVPSDAIDPGATNAATDDTIALPYNGTVVFEANATDATTYDAEVTFDGSNRSSRALCTFLSSGDTGVIITGPMGSEYQIGDTDCDSTTAPSFTVTYQR